MLIEGADMSILRTNSLSITAWRLGALVALTLAALMLLPAVALAQTPPGAPSAVTVTRADGALTATWPAVPNADEYHITYTSDNGKSWTAAASPGDNYSQNSVTINNADNGKPYIVGVRAGNAHGWSDWRNSPSIAPLTPRLPRAASRLRALTEPSPPPGTPLSARTDTM